MFYPGSHFSWRKGSHFTWKDILPRWQHYYTCTTCRVITEPSNIIMTDSDWQASQNSLPSKFLRLADNALGQAGELHPYSCIVYSLVPRLPCSGMRTLKLCRRGKPGIFSHVRSGKGREEFNCAWAYPRLRTGKRAKVASNLLHVSSYRALNIIRTKH